MQKSWSKKALVVGIIVLFIGAGVVPSISGIEKSDTINISHQSNDKPDLKIVDVKIEYDRNGWPHFHLYVKNSGNASVPGGWKIASRLTFKRLFSNESVYSATEKTWGIKSHGPGEIKVYYIHYVDVQQLRTFISYRIFFEVDPYNTINESNEDNNIVWTYITGFWRSIIWDVWVSCTMNLGKLRQSHPKNVDITCYPLLYRLLYLIR